VRIKGYSAFSGVSLVGDYGTGGGGGGSQTYSNTTDYAISDYATVYSPITVSGRSGNAATSTQIKVDIKHTYIGDLKVDLIAPDGSVYGMHNRSGGSADNIIKTYTGNLSSEALNGTWRLRVTDSGWGDTGKIDSWSVTF
jgi:subtilisin-like proprotein convertase family protein